MLSSNLVPRGSSGRHTGPAGQLYGSFPGCRVGLSRARAGVRPDTQSERNGSPLARGPGDRMASDCVHLQVVPTSALPSTTCSPSPRRPARLMDGSRRSTLAKLGEPAIPSIRRLSHQPSWSVGDSNAFAAARPLIKVLGSTGPAAVPALLRDCGGQHRFCTSPSKSSRTKSRSPRTADNGLWTIPLTLGCSGGRSDVTVGRTASGVRATTATPAKVDGA